MADKELEAHLQQLRETLDWMTFLGGWLAGHKAGGGDPNADGLTQQAHVAYEAHIRRQAESRSQ